MLRADVNQAILDLYERPSYLEIGVFDGNTFNAVRAARKVAVDIAFSCDLAAERVAVAGQDVHFHECSSDDYFAHIIGNDCFDVIFIDGLHTFDQTLRDLLNAIGHLREGGTIVIDDVLPPSYAASLPSQRDSNAFRAARGIRNVDWMGDVYRVIFFLRDYLPGFSFATLVENHGETVLWRQTRAVDAATRPVEQISRLGFADCQLHREAFNIRPFGDIMDLLRARRR
ncbi:MAG TPA: class I SAM-dependent methyltransferase [Sphingomonas sp.]|jgi:SAM-dependent methyltransferase|uniref:class I SAM-dependent methyltransferase n=1 Tax=Sphingomonas sp. TaxID=28214 RepID=UPI002EDB165E